MILENMFCINLEKSKEKKESVSVEFDKYSMDIDFVTAIDGSDFETNERGLIGGYQALSQTIIGILENAIDNDFDSITIFEDDVRFTENPIEAVENALIPENVDVFYLGARAYGATPKTEDTRVKRILGGAVLGHAFTILKPLYLPFKAELEKFEQPSDLCLSNVYTKILDENNNPKYKAYYFKSGIAYQEAGFSDNLNRKCKKRWVD